MTDTTRMSGSNLEEKPGSTLAYDTFTQIECVLEDGVLTLSLARPEKQNAMGIVMVDEMERALDLIAADPRVRVVILQGRGAHFCAGMDMRDFFAEGTHPPGHIAQARRKVDRLREGQLRRLPQPVVAAIRGNYLGAAITLVESSDIVLVAEDASFGFPEINFGFIFGGAIAKTAMALMPRSAAVYYGLTGEVFGAAEAVQFGIAMQCLPPERLAEEAMRVARRLASKDPAALALSKESIQSVPETGWEFIGGHTAGKVARLQRMQSGPGARDSRVRDFLNKEFKPWHGDKP